MTGEILPLPPVSQQFGISLTPDPDNTQSTNDSSSNMSSTIETTSTLTFRPTTEGGYEDSPMAHIIRQYKEDSSDEDTSTCQPSITLTTKTYLLRSDIVELGSSEKSYSLRSSLLEDVTQVVNELQIFLERTSALIPEQTSFFKVDPQDTFISILRESSDICQLRAAWMGLGYNMGTGFPAVIFVWCLRVWVWSTNLLTCPTPYLPSRFHGF